MRYLLDTHTIIWYVENNPDLPIKIRIIIEDKPELVLFSMVSFWEMSIKMSLAKLELSHTLDQIKDRLIGEGLELLPIGFSHIKIVKTLPHHHRDPFDRMLIAQADVESCTILSRDAAFMDYSVPVLW